MPELITLSEFARRIGVSPPAVTKAVKAGRIKVVSIAAGNRKMVDYETALAAWKSNTNPGLGRAGGGADVAGDQAPDFATARALKEHLTAELLKLDLEERTGRLIQIEAVAKIVESEYSRVRARILAIPTACAAELAMSSSVAVCREILMTAITGALAELSNPSGWPRADGPHARA